MAGDKILFFQGELPAIVWGKRENKPLFNFYKKRLETNDSALIKILEELGYESENKLTEEDTVSTPAGNQVGPTTTGSPKRRVRLSRDKK